MYVTLTSEISYYKSVKCNTFKGKFLIVRGARQEYVCMCMYVMWETRIKGIKQYLVSIRKSKLCVTQEVPSNPSHIPSLYGSFILQFFYNNKHWHKVMYFLALTH